MSESKGCEACGAVLQISGTIRMTRVASEDADTAEALRLLDRQPARFDDPRVRTLKMQWLLGCRDRYDATRDENAKLREQISNAVENDARAVKAAEVYAPTLHMQRAFVAAVAALPCVHGRKREDGPCPAYDLAAQAASTEALTPPTCPPCAARCVMASEERDG